MQYELYVDSLFLVNFVMNLYLLLLVGRSGINTPGILRMVAGAAYGALTYFLPFFLPGPGWFKLLTGVAAGSAGMILITFRVRGFRAFLKLLEKLFIYSFFLGGILLFVIRRIPASARGFINIFSVMAMGAAGGMLLLSLLRSRKKPDICRATLIYGNEKITVAALLDSGNSLIEPISGKPVSIIGKDVFQSLWKEETPGFRAVPYHSIGKKRGILQGYLLPELRLVVGNEEKSCKDIYVAVSEEVCGEKLSEQSVKMILHPALLQS